MKKKIFLIFSILLIFLIIFVFLSFEQKKKVISMLPGYFEDKIKRSFVSIYENLPDKLQYTIKIFNLERNFWQQEGNPKSLLAFNNDYNVKFLPETQFEKIKFIKKKINLKDNIIIDDNKKIKNFYQSENLTNIGSFDFYNNKNIFITGSSGYLYNLTLNKDEILSDNNLQANLIETKVNNQILDIFIKDKIIYISHKSDNSECIKFYVSSSTFDNNSLNFKNLISSDECSKGSVYGGRIKDYNHNNSDGLLITTSEVKINNPNNKPQDENSIYGKILFYNFSTKKYVIFSKGHRNPQGLFIDMDKDVILSTEHGPQGGDEINKIEFNKNYGWPLSSYGKRYDKNKLNPDLKYFKSHAAHGFEEPIFTFIPSIGISEIIKIPNNFSENWQNNYFVSSLNGRSLYRIKFSEDFSSVVYNEKIYVGNRIRDLKYDKLNNFFILSLQDSNELGFLINENHSR